MERFVLHEYHVADFHASHEVLNGRSKVTSSSPDILNKSDLLSFNSEGLSQPPEVELNALILEEFIIVWVVKHLDTKHNES